MKKYQQVTQLLLKSTSITTTPVVQKCIDHAHLNQLSDQHLDPMIRYLDSLSVHKEYLDFFQIGVYRDQKQKIAKVAKYVGLAIREVETPFGTKGSSGEENKSESSKKENK